jgi:hypothetical protein
MEEISSKQHNIMLDSTVSNIHNSKEGGKIINYSTSNKKKKSSSEQNLPFAICYLQHHVQ